LFLDQECHTDIILNGIINFNVQLHESLLLPTNILQYVGNTSTKLSTKELYFCDNTYTITEETISMSKTKAGYDLKLITKTKFKSKAFVLLPHDLYQAAFKSGFSIFRSGDH